MLIVDSYAVAVALCVVTMLCWGSWANTLKLASKEWPFPLYYWDYAAGLVLTSLAVWLLNRFVLVHAPYLRLISFIVVIACLVQIVEMAIKKLSPALFRALGIYLPLITTNCGILGLAIFQTNRAYTLAQGLAFAFGAGLGLMLALVLMASIREEVERADVPKLLRTQALVLFIAGSLSLAFMGFAGLGSAS